MPYHNNLNHFPSSKASNELQRQLGWREASELWTSVKPGNEIPERQYFKTRVSLELLVCSFQETSQLLLYLLAFWIIWVLRNVAYREGGCLTQGPASIWNRKILKHLVLNICEIYYRACLESTFGLGSGWSRGPAFCLSSLCSASCLCTSFLCKQTCCCPVHSAVSQASICDLAVPRPPLQQGWLKARLYCLTAVLVPHSNRKRDTNGTTNAFEYNEVVVPAHPAVAVT